MSVHRQKGFNFEGTLYLVARQKNGSRYLGAWLQLDDNWGVWNGIPLDKYGEADAVLMAARKCYFDLDFELRRL